MHEETWEIPAQASGKCHEDGQMSSEQLTYTISMLQCITCCVLPPPPHIENKLMSCSNCRTFIVTHTWASFLVRPADPPLCHIDLGHVWNMWNLINRPTTVGLKITLQNYNVIHVGSPWSFLKTLLTSGKPAWCRVWNLDLGLGQVWAVESGLFVTVMAKCLA